MSEDVLDQREKAAFAAVASALANDGYSESEPGILTRRLEGADDVRGWLGLNTATDRADGSLLVNPVVGVVHLAIERVVRQLLGREADGDDIRSPTVAVPLGHLMSPPSFRQWSFPISGDTRAAAADLADAVRSFGDPFMSEYVHRPTLAARLPELALDEDVAYRLPVALALDGDYDAAREALCRRGEDLAAARGSTGRHFRRFSQNFEHWLEERPGSTSDAD